MLEPVLAQAGAGFLFGASMQGETVFFPYGSTRDDAPAASAEERWHPGAAEVQDGSGATGTETYFLDRAAGHWLLKSRLLDGPERLLARVGEQRLPAEPAGAAVELLTDLWTLRNPTRLRFIRALQAGALGDLRWRRIAAALATAPPLERVLRAEGHAVRTSPGPIGTTEHVLLLRQG
jgi:hypothetical protein